MSFNWRQSVFNPLRRAGPGFDRERGSSFFPPGFFETTAFRSSAFQVEWPLYRFATAPRKDGPDPDIAAFTTALRRITGELVGGLSLSLQDNLGLQDAARDPKASTSLKTLAQGQRDLPEALINALIRTQLILQPANHGLLRGRKVPETTAEWIALINQPIHLGGATPNMHGTVSVNLFEEALRKAVEFGKSDPNPVLARRPAEIYGHLISKSLDRSVPEPEGMEKWNFDPQAKISRERAERGINMLMVYPTIDIHHLSKKTPENDLNITPS